MRTLNFQTRLFTRIVCFTLATNLFACGKDSSPHESSSITVGHRTYSLSQGALKKVDKLLAALAAKGANPKQPDKAMPNKLLRARTKTVGNVEQIFVDVLIKATPQAIAKLQALGIEVRTITSNGIITASMPLDKLDSAASLTEVSRIEAAKTVTKYMDVSLGPTGLNVPSSMRPQGQAHQGGNGVVVGVVDTGIDWKHADFRNSDGAGTTRVYAVWDQSDYSDGNPPGGGKTYGYVYTQSAINDCITGTGSYCVQKDTDGHGTHVAGTAAGNGRAFGYGSSEFQLAGVAPEANLVIVKFDFDGSRNTDASIIDGIDWIFSKAAELGLPAVINLSLGSDYGPHDGTTLEEQGINGLTGAGKIVVAAAGNPGRTGDNTWGNLSLWGTPLHGSSTIPSGSYSEISVTLPAGGAGDYFFLLGWYGGGDTTQFQIIAPSGQAYPPNFNGQYKNTWKTGSATTYFNTTQGSIIVGNGGDQGGWGSNNGDHEFYVELSDYNNANKVAAGTWKIRIYDRGLTEGGGYHSWHGNSAIFNTAHPSYDGTPSNNTMTVGSPATAGDVIAIGAYTTRMGWEYKDLNATNGVCAEGTPCCQSYNDFPGGALKYYDPFFVDANANSVFDANFAGGGHACYFDDAADTAEPFNTIAFFSARGPTRDGRTKPEIAAPGVGIVASMSQDTLAAEMAQANVNNTYYRRTNRIFADGLHSVLQGTSMACPHGTGAVALLLAEKPTMTPTEVRTVLSSTARTDSFTTDVNAWGAGKLDVTTALASVSKPKMLAPTPGSTLTGDTITFSWSANTVPVTAWWLYVGAAIGTRYIYDSGALGTATSTVVSGLPINGSTVYVRLWYVTTGAWQYIDYQYTARAAGAPYLASPVPGSTLSSAQHTFQWSANGSTVTNWWLYVGNAVGTAYLHDSGPLGSVLSTVVNNLPIDGRTLYIRLWYYQSAAWQYIDYQANARPAGTPSIVTPAPNSTFSGNSVTFTWIADGNAVTNWWLYIGSAIGMRYIHDSGALGTATSTTVNGLPTNGQTVYVRLWYYKAGAWLYTDHQFTAATSP